MYTRCALRFASEGFAGATPDSSWDSNGVRPKKRSGVS